MQLLETIRNGWKVVELRKKIFYTVFIIILFRIGSFIPAPFIDAAKLSSQLADTFTNTGNTLFSYLSILTGGALEYGAIFAMGVTPYINSSIIIQLLTVAIPPLERLSKEGEEGRKKLAAITRYATVILALIQGIVYYIYLRNQSMLSYGKGDGVFAQILVGVIIVLCFTAGSAVIMWMGEQIDEKGIGNGISIILFAGIISRGPRGFAYLWGQIVNGNYIPVIAVCVLFLAIIAFIVFMTGAERRIPVQYAKRVVGRKMYGGQNTHLPIQVNMAGVLPIIFASSILAIPTTITAFAGGSTSNPSSFLKFLDIFSYERPFYAVLYLILIVFFSYFYIAIQYNPVEMANNLRKNSGVIPGIRPGKPTSDFIGKIISKITLMGAFFLGVMAILPIIVGRIGNINVSLGGTSILILVGVALDTVKSIESQMMMRYYEGFLD